MGKEKLPLERDGIIHKFQVGKQNGYIIVGTYPDGRVGEICIVLKTGDQAIVPLPKVPDALLRCEEFALYYSELLDWESAIIERERLFHGGMTGLLIQFGIAVSIALQNGVPLADLCDKFSFTRFEPSGRTRNRDIRVATSIPDYVFRWLRNRFVPAEDASHEQEGTAQAGADQGGESQGRSGQEGS